MFKPRIEAIKGKENKNIIAPLISNALHLDLNIGEDLYPIMRQVLDCKILIRIIYKYTIFLLSLILFHNLAKPLLLLLRYRSPHYYLYEATCCS